MADKAPPGDNDKKKREGDDAAAASSSQKPQQPQQHGFRAVPRELIAAAVKKDQARAHAWAAKAKHAVEGDSPGTGASTSTSTGAKESGSDGGGTSTKASGSGGGSGSKRGGGGGKSALQRALDEEVEAMGKLSLESAPEADRIYKQVMQAFPCAKGRELSKQERAATKRSATTLIYGEITFRSMGLVLDKIRTEYGRPRRVALSELSEDKEEGGVGDGIISSSSSTDKGIDAAASDFDFEGIMQEPGKDVLYDIGSGTGKPLFAAAAVYPFKKVVGIEILENLHGAAEEILVAWNEAARLQLRQLHGGVDTEVELIQGDFTDLRLRDWPADCDVAVANSTCYDDKLMHRLGELAAGMKQGSFFITLSKRLPCRGFKVLHSDNYHMSWGGATVFIQQKLTPPASTYRPPSI